MHLREYPCHIAGKQKAPATEAFNVFKLSLFIAAEVAQLCQA